MADFGARIKLDINASGLDSKIQKAVSSATIPKIKIDIDKDYIQKQFNSVFADLKANKNVFEGMKLVSASEFSAITAQIKALQTAGNAETSQVISNEVKKQTAKKQTQSIARTAADEEAKAAKQAITTLGQRLNLEKQISSFIEKNPHIKNTIEYEKLNNYLSRLRNEASLTSAEIKEMSNEVKKSQMSLQAMGKTGDTGFDRLKKGWEKFGGWSLVTQSLSLAIRKVKEMVTNVRELDTAMTELRKVTDETDAAYEKFLNQASSTAKSIGATVSDTVNSTADFARLGYSLDEAAELAKAALIYKNVGDGIEDISEASESIISTMKAFNIEAEHSMNIVDMFNEVGNNFAISSEGVGTALEKSASALAGAGNTIEESIGLITAMNAVVQNPEVVGTAVKTLTMYLRAAKAQAEEAGESTEDMANSVSELQYDILALTNGKVDILLDANNFKSTYQIIKEIAAVWKDMAEIDQAALLKLIAGKRNANSVQALITNFSDAEKAVLTAADSDGSATSENEKYLDSIEGKISQLKATWETFSNTILSSTAIKNLIEGLTTLLNILDKITDLTDGKLTGGLTTLSSVVAGIASLNGVGELIKQFRYSITLENEYAHKIFN